MTKDREAIHAAISAMLKKPDMHGAYPTDECYALLEDYIERARADAIGSAFSMALYIYESEGDLTLADLNRVYITVEKELSK